MKTIRKKYNIGSVGRLKTYYVTAIFSMIFAVVGFSYNLWRVEVTEKNSTIRTASFSVLNKLAELEQNIYAAHYDQDFQEGNPRHGWVKVGLIVDLSSLISQPVKKEAKELKMLWGKSWTQIPHDEIITNRLISSIDSVRNEIEITINDLK